LFIKYQYLCQTLTAVLSNIAKFRILYWGVFQHNYWGKLGHLFYINNDKTYTLYQFK